MPPAKRFKCGLADAAHVTTDFWIVCDGTETELQLGPLSGATTASTPWSRLAAFNTCCCSGNDGQDDPTRMPWGS